MPRDEPVRDARARARAPNARAAASRRAARVVHRSRGHRGRGLSRVSASASDDAPADASADASDAAHRALAVAFVDARVRDGHRVGVGAGPIVAAILSEIHARLADGALADVRAVPTGTLSAKEAAVAGVPVDDLDAVPAVDVLVLEPDEVVVGDLDDEGASFGVAAVLGRAQRPVQPNLILLHAVMRKSIDVVMVADQLQDPAPLGGTIPIAMSAASAAEWEEAAEELDDAFLGDAEVWRRGAESDANPRGGKQPYVSPDGTHTVVDLKFVNPTTGGRWEDGMLLFGKKATPWQIAEELEKSEGVLAHGIVTRADAVVVVDRDAPGGARTSTSRSEGGNDPRGTRARVNEERSSRDATRRYGFFSRVTISYFRKSRVLRRRASPLHPRDTRPSSIIVNHSHSSSLSASSANASNICVSQNARMNGLSALANVSAKESLSRMDTRSLALFTSVMAHARSASRATSDRRYPLHAPKNARAAFRAAGDGSATGAPSVRRRVLVAACSGLRIAANSFILGKGGKRAAAANFDVVLVQVDPGEVRGGVAPPASCAARRR